GVLCALAIHDVLELGMTGHSIRLCVRFPKMWEEVRPIPSTTYRNNYHQRALPSQLSRIPHERKQRTRVHDPAICRPFVIDPLREHGVINNYEHFFVFLQPRLLDGFPCFDVFG
ncbi:MAG: hypothetical protein KIT00_04360, partial [Rhodospirillales bacterium]|nr:hypothetical protein [Rhodospirillales bacterium]